MELTVSQIRCLLAAYTLAETMTQVKSKDVAKLLGVTKPSAHRTLQLLAEEGLLDKERYGDVKLTPAGIETAALCGERKDRLTMLFASQYSLPMDEASNAALLLISGLKEESLEKLR